MKQINIQQTHDLCGVAWTDCLPPANTSTTVDRKIDELNKCCFCWDIVGINESYRHFANAKIPQQLPLGVLVAQTGN